jgi:hypothetical protein
MIRRAPAWAWLALVGIAGLILLIGVTTTFSGDGNGAKAAPAAGPIVLTEERQYITLLGPDRLAGPVDLDQSLKVGECPRWLGPAGTIVHYQDGFEVGIEELSPHPSVGQVFFRGPAGQMVGVRKTTDC